MRVPFSSQGRPRAYALSRQSFQCEQSYPSKHRPFESSPPFRCVWVSASGGYHGALPVQVQGLLKPQGEQRAEPPVRGHRGAQPAESLGSSLVALYWRARPLRGFAPRAGIAARNPESSPPFRSSESSPSLRCAWVSASPDPGGHRAAQARAPHRHRGQCPFGRNEPARPGSPCIRAKAPSHKFV